MPQKGAPEPRPPPRTLSLTGAPRRVGVELEFSGVDCARTARLIARSFGGGVVQEDTFRYRVNGTRLGDFVVELDMGAAHPKKEQAPLVNDAVENAICTALGRICSLVMPYEVAAPPIAIDRLPELDRLVAALREAGARGTRGNPLHAFGMQLNPELAAADPGYLADHLRAYLLLSPWLREEIDLDLSRRMTSYVDPFPPAYVRTVVDPGYRPSLPRLIDDYLAANPTRNRELDLLPAFAHLAPDRVLPRLLGMKIKPRPTFHYRLPDSQVDDPDWSIVADWNRWVEVERLADDTYRLKAMALDYLAVETGRVRDSWPDRSRRWIASL